MSKASDAIIFAPSNIVEECGDTELLDALETALKPFQTGEWFFSKKSLFANDLLGEMVELV